MVIERAFHFFGGARCWMADGLRIPRRGRVLEVGYGQGLFTAELAERAKDGCVSAVDFHSGRVTTGPTRSALRHLHLLDKVELVTGEATKLPFRNTMHDCAASFLGFQDIEISRGNGGVYSALQEMCRVVKPGGNVAIADDCFPECRPGGDQGRLFDAMRKHWHTLLPSIQTFASTLQQGGVAGISVMEFEPGEWIPPTEAERELRLAVEWAKPQGILVDFDAFWREAETIVRKEGRRFSKVIVIGGRKTG